MIVDKPAGVTSHDVVARVRRLLGTRKVGHAGTLDPMATGVLVLGVGRATRLLGHLMLTEKAYDATVRFGVTTVTDDAEGDVLETRPTDHLTEPAVREALARFTGELDQVPTAVSAVKVDGKRAYQRVRDGEEVALEPRRVTVHELVVHEVRLPEADFSLRCSSGTYVRAIARDAGAVLDVGGHLTALRRTAVGPFGLAEAVAIDDPREPGAAPPAVVPIAVAARAAFAVRRPRRRHRRSGAVRPPARPAARRADRALRPGGGVPRPLPPRRRRCPPAGRVRRLLTAPVRTAPPPVDRVGA